MNILLAAATEAEIAPTLEWLRAHAPGSNETGFTLGEVIIHPHLSGVGIMAATESFTRALLTEPYTFALQAGVAGAFNRNIPLGEVVRVETEILADLGAEDRDGDFLDVYTLGLARKDDAPFTDGRLHDTGAKHALGAAFSSLRCVSGLTVQTVSGTEKTIAARAARYSADVETMEGAPFHYCCAKAGVPFVQLRAISNHVEPRDRAAWKLKEAITALNRALIGWMELWPRDTPARP